MGFAELPYESAATPWVDFTVTAPLLAVGVKCAAGAVVARDAMRRTWLADAPTDGESRRGTRLPRDDVALQRKEAAKSVLQRRLGGYATTPVLQARSKRGSSSAP
jgi:hypothetical protein